MSNNTANGSNSDGGGISATNTNLQIDNITFSGNEADDKVCSVFVGAALSQAPDNTGQSTATIASSTIASNPRGTETVGLRAENGSVIVDSF